MQDSESGHAGKEQAMRMAFVSHASKDKARAQAIVEHLEGRGLGCWVAPRDLRAGSEYGEEIMAGIRQCRCMVLVLSDAANESAMVRREVERAVSLGKPVFPIRVQEVLPSKSLEFFVSSTHWIDAWQDDLTDHLERLADLLLDEPSFYEAVENVRVKRQKRKLFKQFSLGSAALFLLVLATLLVVLFGGDPSDEAYEDPVGVAAKSLGFDIETIVASDISHRVKINEIMSHIVIVGNQDVLALGNTGLIQMRVGDGIWETAYSSPLEEGIGYIIKESDFDRDGPLQVRFAPHPGSPGKIYGPFTYDMSLQAERNANADKGLAEVKQYAANADWLVRYDHAEWAMTQEGSSQLAIGVKRIEFGPSEKTLRIIVNAPTKSKVESSLPEGTHLTEAMRRISLGSELDIGVRRMLSPFSRTKVLYARVVFSDGTFSRIREFRFD